MNLYILGILGVFCFAKSLSSWVTGIRLLIVALLFGGIIGARMGSGAIPILFRDAAIISPLYAAFFLSKAGTSTLRQLPGDVVLTLCAVLVWLALCLFNPGDLSGLQLMVGLKVWAFYIPFLVVGAGLAARPEAMFKVFRCFLIAGLIACAVGLMQSVLIRVIGYGPAITLFFGEGAKAATQGFTYFVAGGGIFRVPGTFSFGSQYVGFLYAYLTVGMIEINSDPDPRYRKLARAAVLVCLLAAVISGTKGALVTFPVFIIGFFAFGLIRNRLLVGGAVMLAVGSWLLSTLGIEFESLFTSGAKAAANYSQTFIFQEIQQALAAGPFGQGIGSNTNAVRYVISGTIGTDFGRLVGLESYFAKVAVELGWVGLIVFTAFFMIIIAKMVSITMRHFGRPTNAIAAPLAIYMGFTVVSLFKAWSLDVDPTNVFFWLALGIMIGIDRVARRQELAPSPALRLEAAQSVPA